VYLLKKTMEGVFMGLLCLLGGTVGASNADPGQAQGTSGDKPFVLVTGGAGYVGSHVCALLQEKGMIPVSFDNYSTSQPSFVRFGPAEEGDIRDAERLEALFKKYKFSGIVHLSALIMVEDSTKRPLEYYETNVGGTLNLLKAATRARVQPFVFASTGSVYGAPKYLPMCEAHPLNPCSPYAASKVMAERILEDAAKVGQCRAVILRFFNAAGAWPEKKIGEDYPYKTWMIPKLFENLETGAPFSIFGQKYDTRDGTCIRDYIHVRDMAQAVVKSLAYLKKGARFDIFNLGTEKGTTNLEVCTAFQEMTHATFPLVMKEPRAGDAPISLGTSQKAREILGWAPEFDLADILRDGYTWHKMKKLPKDKGDS
jgi:UDP-glucose 4-epimerase